MRGRSSSWQSLQPSHMAVGQNPGWPLKMNQFLYPLWSKVSVASIWRPFAREVELIPPSPFWCKNGCQPFHPHPYLAIAKWCKMTYGSIAVPQQSPLNTLGPARLAFCIISCWDGGRCCMIMGGMPQTSCLFGGGCCPFSKSSPPIQHNRTSAIEGLDASCANDLCITAKDCKSWSWLIMVKQIYTDWFLARLATHPACQIQQWHAT